MSDPEAYTLRLPGVCVDCGAPMRTRGRDGRCSRCLAPWPRVTCRGWRTASGAPMGCADPVMQAGDPGGREIQGQCPVCAEMDRQARAKAAIRAANRTMRNFREPHEVQDLADEEWDWITRGQER